MTAVGRPLLVPWMPARMPSHRAPQRRRWWLLGRRKPPFVAAARCTRLQRLRLAQYGLNQTKRALQGPQLAQLQFKLAGNRSSDWMSRRSTPTGMQIAWGANKRLQDLQFGCTLYTAGPRPVCAAGGALCSSSLLSSARPARDNASTLSRPTTTVGRRQGASGASQSDGLHVACLIYSSLDALCVAAACMPIALAAAFSVS